MGLPHAYAGPEPVQFFYLPLPEASVQRTLVELQPGRTVGQTIESVTSLTTTRDTTIIYYDHWENGYEIDIANPVNIYSASNPGGTQIWGDGDPANGIPPGFVTDVIDADAVIALKNDVPTPRNASVILYDSRDKLASTKAVAMTRAAWATNPGTVLAGAVEVYSTAFLGTEYTFPIGEDLAGLSEQMFEYVSVFIMATEDGTTVQIDLDGDGSVDVTRTLNEGENYFASGVETGGTVSASENVQVHLLTGNLSNNGGNLEARWFTQLPRDTWSSQYYNPVGSSGSNQPTKIYLYNPNASAINIDYETFVSNGSINVPAGEVAEYIMPSSSGAVFTSQGGQQFFGIACVAAGNSNGGSSSVDNDTWDWGFSLVPEEILTPQVVVGWGPGADDVDNNGIPDAQGSPVWVAVTESTVVYVDYDGDASTGPNTDPNGNKYDVALNMNRLQQTKVYGPNNDQTGMKLYTVDGVLLTAAWGQDPSTAGAGNPYLDLGTTVPPFPFPQLVKTAQEVADGDGIYEPGDTVEYAISVTNLGAVPLADLKLSDDLPPNVSYVPGTLVVGGVAQSDDASGTPFPLDGIGIVLPTIGVREELIVTFYVTLDPAAAGSLVNTAILDIGPEILVADSLSSSSNINVVNNRVAPDIEFTDSGYNLVSLYNEGDDIYVQLADDDLNISPVNIDSFTVVVTNSDNGDFELLELVETGVNTGIFRGGPLSTTSGGSPTAQDDVLKINVGDTLAVSATDPGDPSGLPNTDSDTAFVPVPTNAKILYLSTDGSDNDQDGYSDRINPSDPDNLDTTTSYTAAVAGLSELVAVQTSSAVTTANANALTFSHTVPNGPDRLLVVGVASGGNQVGDSPGAEDVLSVTFNGQPLSRYAFSEEPGGVVRSEIWYLVNPTATTANVIVTMANGSTRTFVAGATTFWGADQLTPFGTAVTAGQDDSGSQTVANYSLTGVGADDIGYSVVAWDEQDSAEGEAVTATGGQSVLWSDDGDNPNDVVWGLASIYEGGGTLNFNHSTTGPSGEWAGVAVPIRQAGGIRLDNVSTGIGNDAFTTITVSHTTANELNRLMVVSLSWQDDENHNIDEDGITISYNGDTGFTRAGIEVGGPNSEEDFVAIYYMIAPDVGTHDLVVSVSGAQSNDSMVAGVTTLYGVDQSQPIRTSPTAFTSTASALDTATSSTLNVTSTTGEVVLDAMCVDDGDQLTSAGSGQTVLYLNNTAEHVSGGGSIKTGDTSVTMSWSHDPDEDVQAAIAIRPAPNLSNVLVFTQNPSFAKDFSMPQGGVVSVEVNVDSLTGSWSSTPDLQAQLSYGGNPFITISDAVYDSGADTLTWTAVLGNDVTIPEGEEVTLTITNLEAGTSFRVAYDSNSFPSYISLPATTVIMVENVDVYDAPYPGGSLVTEAFVGQQLYIRTTICDPFGAADITDPSIQITDPNTNNLLTPDPSLLDSVGNLIASDADSLTYEYSWQTPATEGAYTITVSADEGTEGTVSDTLQTVVNLAGVDGGTPATITFTTGDNGPNTSTYGSVESIAVRVVDYDENEDPGLVDTITVTITTSNGDSDVVILVETGPNTGIFTAIFPSATDTANADDDDINAPQGTGLTVTYVDDDDPGDTAEAYAAVPNTTPNTAAVSINKTLVTPSDGAALVGDQVIYNITITNVGSVGLTTTPLDDVFVASELAFVSASIAPDSNTVSGLDRTLSWNDLGALAVGESVTVTVTYTATAAGNISSTATVNATSGVGPASDSDTEILPVTNPALSITKDLIGGAQTVYYGNLVEYTITLENSGNTAIESLPFTDNYSSCLQFLGATVAPDASGGGVLLWNDLYAGAATMAPAATTQITVTFLVVGECDPALNVAEARFAIDVNGDPVPPAEAESEDLITDAASISGTVWQDDDGSGLQNGAEVGLVGIRVYLDLDGDGVRDANEPFDITDSDGDYRIGNLAEGTSSVRIDENFLDDSLSITTPGSGFFSLTLAPGEDADADFGLERTTVTGIIFNDLDGDGDTTPGAGENGIGGVDVIITDSLGNVQTIRTLADGSYTAEVAPGTVWVDVEESSLPAGYTLTTDTGVDNEPQSLTAVAGVNAFSAIGYQQPQGVAGHLFIDLDNSGAQDGGEPNLPGVTVFYDANTDGILDPDGLDNILGNTDDEVSTVTDSAGNYVLEIPTTGSVSIKVDTSTLPGGLDTTPTTANDPQSVTVNASATTTAADTGFAYSGLGILKTANISGDVEPGDTITYTITVNNNSGSTMSGVDITDTLPADVTFVVGSLNVSAPSTVGTPIAVAIDEDFASLDGTGGSPISSSGSLGWVGNWLKFDEASTPDFDEGEVQILDDPDLGGTQNVLRIQGNGQGNGGGGAIRALDLALADSAELSFQYRRNALENTEFVSVQLSNDGGLTFPVTLFSTPTINGSDGSYTSVNSLAIPSAYLTSNTQVRFVGDPSFFDSGFDQIYIDNITIDVAGFVSGPQTGVLGNFPTNDEIANGFDLGDGQTIIITYKVKVVADPANTTIANTAAVVSDQQPLAVESTATNTVYEPPTGILSGFVLEDTDGDGNGNIGIQNVLIELLDTAGNQIDSDASLPGLQPTYATTDSNGEYSFENIPAGDYQVRETQPAGFLSVVGADDGGDVNILGDVSLITISAVEVSGNTFVEQRPAIIFGYVYEDFDSDGDGDIGISGVTLELLDAAGASIDSDLTTPGVQATTTSSTSLGAFFFTNLTPGATYQVRQIQPTGYVSVSDSDGGNPNRIGDITPITVTIGFNAGYYFVEELLPVSFSGAVLDDTDGDGDGDAGIGGVRVFIDRNSNGVYDASFDIETTTTGGTGAYSFSNLRPGVYQIVAEDALSYVSISDFDGGDASITILSLPAGSSQTGVNFIDGIPSDISGTVIDDINGDGLIDGGDGILAGVTIEIYEDLNQNGLYDFAEVLIATTTTNGSGNYTFTVPAGDYVIVEIDPNNYQSTADSVGANDNQIGITIAPNNTYANNNFLDVNQGPNLTVSKTLDGATNVNYGAAVSYTIEITNDGNTNFDSVPLADTYDPSLLEYVSASPLPDSAVAGTLTWNDLGALATGATHTVTVNFTAIDTANPATNTATVTDAEDEFGTLISHTDDDSTLIIDTANISGNVWEDADGNGALNGGEAGFSGGVIVYIDANDNGTRDINEPFDIVDPSGDYTISGLVAGVYRVRVDESTLPSANNYAITTPALGYIDVTIDNATEDETGHNFGYQPQSGSLSITKIGTSPAGAGGAANPGETITYTITVTNNDSVTHTGVNIADIIPNGTTYVGSSISEVSAPANYRGGGSTVETLTVNWTNGLNSGTASGSVLVFQAASSWTIANDGANNINSGNIQIVNDINGNALRVEGQGNGSERISRNIDLTGLNPATDTLTVSFDWRGESLNQGSDDAIFELNDTELIRVGDGTNSGSFSSAGATISTSYFGSTPRIDFQPTSQLDGSDWIYFDNIVFTATIAAAPISQTGSVSDPSTSGPSIIASNYGLDPGDSLVISYQVTVDGPMPEVSTVQNTATVDSNELASPLNVNEFNAINVGSISGSVLADNNGDGVGDNGLSNVVITLLNSDGSSIDSPDPTTTTNALGQFSFENMPLGSYRIVQLSQPAGYISVSDSDGANNNTVGDETALSISSNGQVISTVRFVEAQFGSISGTVYEDLNLDGDFDGGEPGIENATITLILDANSNGVFDVVDVVTGITATTDVNGDYSFASVPIGRYILRESDAVAYYSTGDDDGANDNLIVSGIIVTNGGSINSGTNFFDAAIAGNRDGDCLPDLVELAFVGNTDSGIFTDSPVELQLVNENTGRFDVIFDRPDGLHDITYTLQGSNNLIGAWFDIASFSSNSAVVAPFSVIDNGGTETITYGNIQNAPGFSSPNFGLVRIRISTEASELYTDVLGWQATTMTLNDANSWGTPFTVQEIYCGPVDSIALDGLTLNLDTVANGADFGSLIADGTYYVEVTGGDNEGHRFQIASGDVNTVTLVADSDIFSPAGGDSYNTINTVPANLAGDDIKIRRYQKFGELFNKGGSFADQYSADPNQTTHIYIYNNRLSVPLYEPYILAYFDAGTAMFMGLGSTADYYWVREDWPQLVSNPPIPNIDDQGLRDIEIGTGFIIASRQAASKLYAYGKVRDHDAALLLNDNGADPSIAGWNLVSSLYPLTQVPIDGADTGNNGRNLTSAILPAADNPDDAAEIVLWPLDPEVSGRTTVFFLLDDVVDAWVDYAEVGGPPYTNLNDSTNKLQFRSNRASLIKAPEGFETVLIEPEPTP